MQRHDDPPPTAPAGNGHPGHDLEPSAGPGAAGQPHHSHRWAMVACCVPMLVIVAVLLATGTAGTGAIVFAMACVGIMTVVMLAMPRGH